MFLAFGVPGSNVVEKEQGKRFRKNNGTIKLSLPLGIQGASETFPLFNLLSYPPPKKSLGRILVVTIASAPQGEICGGNVFHLSGKMGFHSPKTNRNFLFKASDIFQKWRTQLVFLLGCWGREGGGEILLLVNFLQLTPKENGVKWRERIFIIFH